MSKLYIVATPIGNLEDITLRALRTLKEVDLVLCEDTRVTKKLLNHYDITTATLSYHQHSGKIKSDIILNVLEQGQNVALVTDAGTPGVSDPGNKLVKEAVDHGYDVEAIPGASAISTAISLAGLQMDRFLFLGFLPHKKGRQTMLKEIEASKYPVIVYESVHRIEKLLLELAQDDELVLLRELTKKFETVYRGKVGQVLEMLKADKVKGEFVVIINK